MKIVLSSIFIVLSLQLNAQEADFNSFIANFITAKSPLTCCNKTNKVIVVNTVNKFLASQPKASSLKLFNSISYEYGYVCFNDGGHILITIYAKDPEDLKTNYHYLLVFNQAGLLLDGRIANGRITNVVNGNAEINDISSIISIDGMVTITTRISVPEVDSNELRLREEIVEKLKISTKGTLVEVD